MAADINATIEVNELKLLTFIFIIEVWTITSQHFANGMYKFHVQE